MKVRAQFYAQLRDLVGSSEMDVDLAEGATVGNLLDQIYAQQPKLRPHDKSILIGAGVEFVDRNYKLKPGDEISIMPPVSKIFEICGDAKVTATDELNHCLQIVFLLSRNSNLSILQLALHLETLRLDRLNDFLRLVPFEALLNFQFLPGVSDR
jgi:molybdopterin converting factor small subunit